LPKGWPHSVKNAILHGISLAQYSIAHARGWAADSVSQRVRLKAELDRALQNNALLREETRIKDARMARIDPHRRPYYPPTERIAILELKAARGWSLEQTARAFLVTAATIASWMSRVEEEGPDALVQLREPVNRFPDFVRYVVQRLKSLCPALGKVKIAEILARAGLHLGTTTVGRILREKPAGRPSPSDRKAGVKPRVVTSRYPDHLWQVDLTTVRIVSGFWTAWLPFSLPQCWPFCWWVAAVLDHFSRRVMGFAVFKTPPTSEALRALLGRTIRSTKATPRHLVCDKGPQFWNDGFKAWCQRRAIRPRFGAIGQHGSIAVIERFIRTMKELLRLEISLVPFRRERFHREVALVLGWYNAHRPHMSLGGRTPDETFFRRRPANRSPRFEPRSGWPRGSPCAKPWALVKGRSGGNVELDVSFQGPHKHLLIVRLNRAA
jgi:putative transposase